MSNVDGYSETTFEEHRRVNDFGEDYWYGRDLQAILDYQQWRNFEHVIIKAKKACEGSGNKASDHFADVSKMVELGSGALRQVNDVILTRYACYLIVQNADPNKEIVALGQTYFAVQTRKQELQNEFESLDEEQKRLAIRNELKGHNKSLAEAAQNAGVVKPWDYATFQNHGYRGLYGGLDARQIKERKELKKSQQILDHMGSTELAANLFRATQTDEKLRRDKVTGKSNANRTHYEVGTKVRQTIEDLGGTMPEDLPTPERSIKQIEREEKNKTLLF